MAELRFNITGNTSSAQRATRDLAGTTDLAAKGARLLADSLDRQRRAAATSVGATISLAKADKLLADAEHALTDGALEAEFALKREAQAAQKSGDAAVRAAAENRTLASSLRKVSESSFFRPSGLGAALALSPTLIPLAAQAAAAVGAIGISFGAAALAAGAFGLVAGTVLAGASQDLAKLKALELKANTATTAAQKKAAQQQIAALKATWAKGYLDLIGIFQDFQAKWKKTAQDIAVPALTAWLEALTRGLQFLQPALKPVADLMLGLGQTLNAYFANNAPHIRDLAAAFGKFAAVQLADVVRFVTDLAKGIFNLGKDLAANGANFSSAGAWLAGIGDGFLTWSKSASARKDVQGFMKFLHDEGPVVKGILSDLGTLLPGIFAGATTIGTLELQALGNFLNLVASLPPGWQKPLTEFAGAMLLLSKIGVVKVGLKLTGLGAGGLAAAGGSAPLGAAGAAIAAGLVLAIREDLQKGILGIGKDLPKWLGGIGGIVSLSAQGWADAIVNHFQKPVLAAERRFGHALLASIKSDWNAITASAVAFGADMRATWDLIWRNTVTRAQHGINDVVRLFLTLPGRAIAALFGLGHALYAKAHAALSEFLSGFTSVAGSILRWLGGFVGKIVGLVGKLLRLGSPSGVFFDIGKNMMLGLEKGIKAHAHKAANAAQSAAQSTTAAGSAGGGVQRWRPTVLRALHMEGLSAGLANDVLYQMQTESGGNPRAINLTDINAQLGTPSKGLMQVIDPTFRYWHWPGTSWNIYNPLANIAAAINYAAHGKGFGSGIGQIGSGHGYDQGGWLPAGLSLAWNNTGRPEQVVPHHASGGGPKVVLQIQPTGTSAFDRFMADWLSDAARVRGGGSLEVAFGNHH